MAAVPLVTAERAAQTKVTLDFRVAPGFHINSNTPKSEFLIATALKMDPPTDIALGKIDYPEGKLPHTRFNDGKVDARGRFVVGEINLKGETIGRFYRLDPDLKCTRLGAGVACFNGPCFSPDGRTLYFSDTTVDTIFACDYDVDSGAVSNRRVLVKTTELGGSPDGCTVDAEGRVWSALVRSGQVGCFTPEGKVERLIKVPPKHVSSTMFGGPNLDQLYITSIGSALGGMLQPNEADGGLYVIRGLGVKGKPEPRFAG